MSHQLKIQENELKMTGCQNEHAGESIGMDKKCTEVEIECERSVGVGGWLRTVFLYPSISYKEGMALKRCGPLEN